MVADITCVKPLATVLGAENSLKNILLVRKSAGRTGVAQ